MDVKEFISTGILESYLLGTASQQEIDWVHQMLVDHPYLKIEIDALEEALLQVARSKKYELSNQLKDKIFVSINFEQERKQYPAQKKSLPPQKQQAGKTQMRSYLRYGMVASISLLLISVVFNMLLLYKNNQANNQLAQLVKTRVHLETELADKTKLVNDINNQIVTLADAETQKIILSGNNGSLANIYWNKRSKTTYIYISHLPPPAPDQQYQLWAMVNGKPVDAGVFNTGTVSALQPVKFIESAQSFAVTLEKKGGSPTPTLSNLTLFGEV